MSTIHGTTELGPASAKRQVYSPLEAYWNAFQEWRKRQRLRATLCDLSDRELMDIGTTRGEIDYVASNRSIDPRGVRSSTPRRTIPRGQLPLGVQGGNTRCEQMFSAPRPIADIEQWGRHVRVVPAGDAFDWRSPCAFQDKQMEQVASLSADNRDA